MKTSKEARWFARRNRELDRRLAAVPQASGSSVPCSACGARPSHPAYGAVCEDCWSGAQPERKRNGVATVQPAARHLVSDGLYALIVDDGVTDPPPEPVQADPAMFAPPPRKGNPLA